MYSFSEASPAEVADLLPIVQEAMPEFQQRPNIDWRPDQLYGMLFLGLATLTMVLQDYSPIGFIIHKWVMHPLTNEKSMHVWLFYIFPEKRGILKEITDPTYEYLSNVCKANSGAYFEIVTTKGGWERQLQHKMELTHLTFRKRV